MRDRLRSSIFPGRRRLCPPGWETAWGLGWSPSGNEIWFSSTRLGYGRYLSAVTLSGKERLLAREPGTLTLQDVAKDGRVLITRDVPRVGMVGMTAGSNKERDLSWLDWSAPKDLSADGKKLLFTESGEAGGENYSSLHAWDRWVACRPAGRWAEFRALARSDDGLCRVCPSRRFSSLCCPPARENRKQLTHDQINRLWARWFPDGKRLLFSARRAGQGRAALRAGCERWCRQKPSPAKA